MFLHYLDGRSDFSNGNDQVRHVLNKGAISAEDRGGGGALCGVQNDSFLHAKLETCTLNGFKEDSYGLHSTLKGRGRGEEPTPEDVIRKEGGGAFSELVS